MVSEEARVLAVFLLFATLFFGEVRDIIRVFLDLISRPVPKFNKYLGMTKVEYDLNVESYNRKQWLSWARIVLLVSIIVFELWMVYAVKFNADDPLEWLANRGLVEDFFQCTCCLGFFTVCLLFQEKFPNWFSN